MFWIKVFTRNIKQERPTITCKNLALCYSTSDMVYSRNVYVDSGNLCEIIPVVIINIDFQMFSESKNKITQRTNNQ